MNILTKLTYKNYDFEVDVASNKSIYSMLTSDAGLHRHDEAMGFYLFNREKFHSPELIKFIDSSGVDIAKENETICSTTDSDQIIIDGWYDIVGRLSSDESLSFYWSNDSFTTNIYFRRDAKHARRDEFMYLNTFRLEFAIVLEAEFLKATDSTPKIC